MSSIKLHSVPKSYLDLIRRFPLRPIRTSSQYSIAESIVSELAIREERLDAWQADYFDVLSDLIEAYDDQHFNLEIAGAGPLETLSFLMNENGMKSSDLGELLGSKGLASDILHGKRQMSKKVILRLAARFNVEPSLFLRSVVHASRKSA